MPYKDLVKQRKYNQKRVSEHRRRRKKAEIDYLGGCCQHCGYDKCPAALEFHHIDDGKDFQISDGNTRSWKRTQAELDKCLLLCSNCHKEVHWHVD